MPQTLDAAHQFGYKARVASGGEGIAGTPKLALKGFQPKLGELHGAREIAGVTFVVHRQLFAGEDDLLRVGDKLVPEARGAIAIAAALGHQSKFACGLRAEFLGETGIEGVGASGMGKVFFAFSVKKFRQAKKINRIGLREAAFARFEKGIDFYEKGSDAAQVHLIVLDDCGEGMARAAAQVIEVILRNECGGDIVFATPAEAGGFENVALKFDEADRAQAQSPERARWMQQVQMRGELWDTHGAGHGEAIFEQRPIESLAVEGDEDWALGDARGELVEQGIFFVEVAEKELLDLQAASVPPGETDQKGVSAGTAGETGGFGVEEEPFFGIAQCRVRAARKFFVASTGKEFQCDE
jgi:hypothetical protein